MSEILRIINLTGGYLPNVPILRGIDLTLVKGEAVGIIGLNGSGKSTLGKAIMNMLPWRGGQIMFAGEDITSFSIHELAKKGIAIMQQGGSVFPNLSVRENLQLAIGRNHDKEYSSILKKLIPLLQNEDSELQERMADKLSGGQRHQLALTMTLAQQPDLVILDEPSAGLTPYAVEEMYDILLQIREQLKVTLLLIEQNINKAVIFCDRCLIMRQGRGYEFRNKNIREIESMIFKK